MKYVKFSLEHIECDTIKSCLDSLKYPNDSSNPLPISRLEMKQRVLQGPFQPCLKMYPRTKIGNYNRSFHEKWYYSFKWLEYSIEQDKGFCFPCQIFMHTDLNYGHKDSAFTITEFNNWHIAIARFNNHQTSKSHTISETSMAHYLNSDSVDVILRKSKEEELPKREQQRMVNRRIMLRLINITLCLLKNGKPFRGHNEQSDSVSRRFFLDMVDLLKKYDKLLSDYLQYGPKNASNISNRIQNVILLYSKCHKT